ncbi:MAG: transcription-repair coupling factor [Alphaproteobacteria bacterium RIFCSPHIGHO2_12_42_13]|nr:MAG: transcription-repair coupling factor [Alphaproteobacteria bacterium RIFCSPHIGHO2_12_42_13]
MSFLPSFQPPTLLTHVPDGYDTLLLAELSGLEKKLVFVARDESRALRIRNQLSFFGPHREPLFFPAWDCLPYDRSSPHADVLAQRLHALTTLSGGCEEYLLITSIQALLQKVPPREAFQGRIWNLNAGQEVDHTLFLNFLQKNGYVCRETVREWGEFALLGGLIDVFPPGYPFPFRLDFFGSSLESLRTFDPLTQITTGKATDLSLKPMGEINLNDETIERFRKGYREAFGTADLKDPLYAAISEGRAYAGYEHWLPLFYEQLSFLTDYVKGAFFCLDDHLEEAAKVFIEQVQDHYQTRLEFESLEKHGIPYNPLAPQALYLVDESWTKALPKAQKVIFTSSDYPDFKGKSVTAGGKKTLSFADKRVAKESLYTSFVDALTTYEREGNQILLMAVSAGSAERLAHILEEHGAPSFRRINTFSEVFKEKTPALTVLEMDKGFQAPGLIVVTEEDLLGERLGHPQKTTKRSDLFIAEASSLQIEDLVVHREHGIGRYKGLQTLNVSGFPHDCIEVMYEGGDKLFVPVENLEVLSRYGGSDVLVSLDRLGGIAWQARKARVKKRLKDIADALLKIAASRHLQQAERFYKTDGLFEEFVARFPYPETEDQLRAIEDVFDDFLTGRPMDRLICGDVGSGKTEVALRAAFIAVSSGKQVAIVVPTTLLARQHFQTFATRFKDTGFHVAQLSRLVKPKDAKTIREKLKTGDIQIIIGTHALLSKTIGFHDLGLLIIDEEQHFGVSQKEKLKALKANVHVLTLTATPIPRTLQMALSGVKEMSLITTPPLDRMAVRTFVLPFDAMVVREALLREQFRGGQSFYVCPRISDIDKVAMRLRHFVPEVKFAIAHGGMSPLALENVMSDFYDGAIDLLLCTNIIESGIDITRANTLIIHRADLFGLAQLYQLRGRIGRGKARGYAYLTYPAGQVLSLEAQKRLDVIQSLDSLGAGFSLASHDMDIRGAGNLVGEEQSGHIREVGIELYQHMLEEAIAALKEEKEGEVILTTEWTPQISLGLSVLIPDVYVADLGLRLSLYKRLSHVSTREEIDQFAVEMGDRFGPLPIEVKNLLDVIYLKALSRQANVEKVEVGPKGVLISFHQNTFKNPEALIQHIMKQKGTAKIRPDQKVVYIRAFESAAARLAGARKILEELVSLAF